MKWVKENIIIIFIFILTISMSRVTYHRANQAKTFDPSVTQLFSLPPADLLKISSLGFPTVLADYLWVKLILRMGSGFILEEYAEHLAELQHNGNTMGDEPIKIPTPKDTLIARYLQKNLEPKFFEYLDKITTIDKRFAFPYMTGFTFEMFYYHHDQKAVYFLRKAMKNVPEYWEFPFYYSFYLFYFEHAPDSVIIPYLIKSVKAPKSIRVFDKTIAQRMLQAFVTRMDKDAKSRLFLYSVFESLGDEKLKQQFLNFLKKRNPGKKQNQ